MWKEVGGTEQEIRSVEKFGGHFLGGYKRSKIKDRSKGKASAQKYGERGGMLRDMRGVKKRDGNGEFFFSHGPYANTLKQLFRVGDLDPPKGGIPVIGWRREKARRAGRVATS